MMTMSLRGRLAWILSTRRSRWIFDRSNARGVMACLKSEVGGDMDLPIQR